jgi:Protein of unknown function (DUF3293)
MTDAAKKISAELEKAYREAFYVIHWGDENIVLKVGHANPELAALMKIHVTTSAAFLTAFNPYSILSTTEENLHNQHSLISDIHSLGLIGIVGEGGDSSNLWPSEPSVLVLGISLQNAELLADRYGQNGFLWISSDDGFVVLNLRYPVGGRINEN